MHDSSSKTGKVYLIGAGPGDPKLITLRAVEALGVSDVVLYDYLVNPEILAHAKPRSELVYAGKRASEPGVSQQEINEMLIARARSGQIVARLKGGDPFVFGRGGEEAEALAAAGIDWEVIPGVSAGIAVAAYAGIPVTHRGLSSSVTFISGHAKDGASFDLPRIPSDGTLVVFMCAASIVSIACALIERGRAASTPAAIIRWGAYEDQEVFSGRLGELASLNEAEPKLQIKPPAIAIIGEVVSLRSKLRWFGSPTREHSFFALADSELCLTGA